MRRGGWYVVAVLGLLIVGVAVAGRGLPGTSAGQYDPISAVIALIGLAVSLVSLWLAARAQRQSDADTVAAAGRLADAVKDAETMARQQLLGGHDRVIDVRFAFRRAPAHNADGVASKGTLAEVVGYYRRLRPGRMVITGAGGSGKTVLAVELILGLLGGRAPTDPVPVRMSAAALNTALPSNIAVSRWVAGHLRQAFGVSEWEARALVAARMVLPVIDGLDEMDADSPGYGSRAGHAIRACNAYLDSGRKAGIVVTCRAEQYQALEAMREWVQDSARIDLQPVGPSQAREFLTGRASDDDRWQPVLKQIRRGAATPLARALSTPWRLTLAATVYEQRDPDTGAYVRDPAELTAPDLNTPEKIRDHLLALFIPAAAALHDSRHPADRVHRWLATLAVYLRQNTPGGSRPARVLGGRTLSGTDLVLHELWPLAGTRLPCALPPAAIGIAVAVTAVVAAQAGDNALGVFLVPFTPVAAGIASADIWPALSRISIRHFRTRSGLSGLTVGLAGGLTVGLVVGLTFGLTVALSLGFTFGLAFGLRDGSSGYSPATPLDGLRSSLLSGLTIGITLGLAFWLSLGLMFGLTYALTDGRTFGVAVGLAFGLRDGSHAARYAALLLCTRRRSSRWLPWRFARFLDWSYDAGLVRIAGYGYQFRHRELQEYLADHPTP